MSVEAIVGRIISDAERQAEKIIAAAEARAAEILEAAKAQDTKNRQGETADVEAKCRAIESGKSAQARLDCAKIALKERHRVIDELYARAQKKLCDMPKDEALKFASRLLTEFAEKGEEIAFSPDFKWAKEVSELPEAVEKKLKISLNAKGVNGGFVLRGKDVDKDVSFSALISEDKEKYRGELIARIFKV